MANSDKNILITPNTGSTTGNPTIRFTGANNTPITLRTLDDGTVSFEGTAGQLFSISDGLAGTIFSVNDISGIPSIEVIDTGEVRLAQYSGNVGIGKTSPATKLDVNGTVTGVNLARGYATTATAAGTTTLTVSSPGRQFFTGSTTQTVLLPVASTLTLGHSYVIHNTSSGSVTVQSSGANAVATLSAGVTGLFVCILTSGTTAASWYYMTASGVQGTTGTQGTTGPQGTTGLQGITGTQGLTGIQGSTGPQGTSGTNGTQGTAGTNGTNGTQGTTGSQGTTGTQGTTGSQGSTGLQGFTGLQGTTGSQGTTGLQGLTGTGIQGTQGISGAAGGGSYSYQATAPISPVVGDRWVDSDTAIEYTYINDGTSSQWVETSASGYVGSQGLTGLQGVQGIIGPQGLTGSIGSLLPSDIGGATGPNEVIVTDETGAGAWTTLTMENIPNAAFKSSVRVATEANITLSGTQTIDGVSLVAGDRVLVKEQTSAQNNGIYVVSAGTWSRAADANSADSIAGGLVAVEEGSTYNGQMLQTSFSLADTLGTTAMYWYPILRKNYYQLTSNRSIASSTSAQSIFGVAFSCDAGATYEFEAFIALNTGTNSHNVSVNFLAGGSLTLTGSSIYTTFSPSTSGSTGGADSTAWATGTSSGGVLTALRMNSSSSTTSSKSFMLRGVIRVNAAGTVTPQLTFSSSPGGTNEVRTESWMTITKLGSNTLTKIGPWA
jgi:hypothetical protein